MNNTGHLDLNHMPQIPEADFSVLNNHVISAHCTGIETESLCPTLCVFVISSLVWSTRILPNGFHYPICSKNSPILKWSCILGCISPIKSFVCNIETHIYHSSVCLFEEASCPPIVHKRIQALHKPYESNSSTNLADSQLRRSPGT